jgi:hypothetical protein
MMTTEQPVRLWRDEVCWTAEDVVGLFADAVARGEPPDAEILRYERGEEGTIRALIREKTAGRTLLYEMDNPSGAPKAVRVLRPVR